MADDPELERLAGERPRRRPHVTFPGRRRAQQLAEHGVHAEPLDRAARQVDVLVDADGRITNVPGLHV